MARIVVADDDGDIRRLMGFTLRRRGHEVVEAAAGDAALALIRSQPPDLVVLDVQMPGLTGLEVLQALGGDAATRAMPVLLVSANLPARVPELGQGTGRVDTLAKPFAPQTLASRVEALLSREVPAP